MSKPLKQLIESLVVEELQGISLFESWRGFSLKQFKKLATINERLAYAEARLPRLGSGASRTVFGLGSGKVLKIVNSSYPDAKHQARNEIEVYTSGQYDDLLAKTFDFDSKDFMWSIAEGVKVIADNKNLLKKFNYSELLLESIVLDANKMIFDKAIKRAVRYHNKYVEDDWTDFTVQKFLKLSDLNKLDYELMSKVYEATRKGIADIDRYDHWGITTSGRLVIVDYGYLTDQI